MLPRKMIGENIPTIVCLCGSTRFYTEFQKANNCETLAGNIVLTVGCWRQPYGHPLHGNPDLTPVQKSEVDELHLRKIDLADEVLVINVNGYVGESTANEIRYAERSGKLVRYLE